MHQQRWIFGVAAILVVAACWMGRYELVVIGSRGDAYRMDRWTGKVALVDGDEITPMADVKVETESQSWWNGAPVVPDGYSGGLTLPAHAPGELPDNSSGKSRR